MGLIHTGAPCLDMRCHAPPPRPPPAGLPRGPNSAGPCMCTQVRTRMGGGMPPKPPAPSYGRVCVHSHVRFAPDFRSRRRTHMRTRTHAHKPRSRIPISPFALCGPPPTLPPLCRAQKLWGTAVGQVARQRLPNNTLGITSIQMQLLPHITSIQMQPLLHITCTRLHSIACSLRGQARRQMQACIRPPPCSSGRGGGWGQRVSTSRGFTSKDMLGQKMARQHTQCLQPVCNLCASASATAGSTVSGNKKS